MAAELKLKLTNRSTKKPFKRLPQSLTIPADANVEDVKIQLSSVLGLKDHNRIGLFNPATRKTLKDRKAQINADPDVTKAGELLVQDLGPQVAWRTVFVIEYIGPILIHLLILALRTTIYPSAPQSLSPTQKLVSFMFISHFIKRELETMFVHKFSASTMPVSNIARNSFFYWFFAGLICSVSIYHPSSLAARADLPIVDYIGLAIFLFGEVSNGAVHLYLSSLRSPGGTERQIPHGYGFSLVTCPNYMFEVISWLGVILASRDWSVVVFITFGSYYMYTWGVGKERAYRKEFGSKYKSKRFVMLPGLL